MKGEPSANPGGRPKGWAEARQACRKLDTETLGVLTTMMRSAESDQVRVMCAIRIRDEAWGKPTQAIEIDSAPAGLTINVPGVREAATQLLSDPEARKALRAALREREGGGA